MYSFFFWGGKKEFNQCNENFFDEFAFFVTHRPTEGYFFGSTIVRRRIGKVVSPAEIRFFINKTLNKVNEDDDSEQKI